MAVPGGLGLRGEDLEPLNHQPRQMNNGRESVGGDGRESVDPGETPRAEPRAERVTGNSPAAGGRKKFGGGLSKFKNAVGQIKQGGAGAGPRSTMAPGAGTKYDGPGDGLGGGVVGGKRPAKSMALPSGGSLLSLPLGGSAGNQGGHGSVGGSRRGSTMPPGGGSADPRASPSPSPRGGSKDTSSPAARAKFGGGLSKFKNLVVKAQGGSRSTVAPGMGTKYDE